MMQATRRAASRLLLAWRLSPLCAGILLLCLQCLLPLASAQLTIPTAISAASTLLTDSSPPTTLPNVISAGVATTTAPYAAGATAATTATTATTAPTTSVGISAAVIGGIIAVGIVATATIIVFALLVRRRMRRHRAVAGEADSTNSGSTGRATQVPEGAMIGSSSLSFYGSYPSSADAATLPKSTSTSPTPLLPKNGAEAVHSPPPPPPRPPPPPPLRSPLRSMVLAQGLRGVQSAREMRNVHSMLDVQEEQEECAELDGSSYYPAPLVVNKRRTQRRQSEFTTASSDLMGQVPLSPGHGEEVPIVLLLDQILDRRRTGRRSNLTRKTASSEIIRDGTTWS